MVLTYVPNHSMYPDRAHIWLYRSPNIYHVQGDTGNAKGYVTSVSEGYSISYHV